MRSSLTCKTEQSIVNLKHPTEARTIDLTTDSYISPISLQFLQGVKHCDICPTQTYLQSKTKSGSVDDSST